MDQNYDIQARCAAVQRRSAAARMQAARAWESCARLQQQLAAQPALATEQPPAPSPDPHAVAMDALRVIRAIIDPFPVEWQIAIVKALTARTIVIAGERPRAAPTALSA